MSHFKNILMMSLTILLAISYLTPPAVAFNQADNETLMMANHYKDFLADKGKKNKDALVARKQFSNLRLDQKRKFLFYITNPSILQEILSVSVPENSTKNMYNGDIEVTNITNITKTSDSDMLSKISSLFINTTHLKPTIELRIQKFYVV